jgi:hypothetical protein
VPKLTNDQKRRLAAAMLDMVAMRVEFWAEYQQTYGQDVADIPADVAAQQFANWLRHLPGDTWPYALPEPQRR